MRKTEAFLLPRKPIYDRAPLVRRTQLPLSTGMLRAENPDAEALLKQLPKELPWDALEGAIRLSACLGVEAEACPAAAAVRRQFRSQDKDGALPCGTQESIALCRAAWFLSGWTGDRALAESVVRWLGWAAGSYETLIADQELRDRPADLTELLVEIYRATGLQGALRLLARLRRDVTDWSMILNTFSLDHPYRESPVTGQGAEEVRKHQRLLADPVALADAMREVRCLAEYSGNGTEHEAGARGWERISRWHGQACGGTSASPLLKGRSPLSDISPASVGAWAECLAGYLAAGERWAHLPLERIAVNALPVATAMKTFTVNRTNTKGRIEKSSLGRLLRGWAALLSTAACLEPDGISLQHYDQIAFAWTDGVDQMTIRMFHVPGEVRVVFSGKKPVRLNLSLPIPPWVLDATVTLCGEEQERLPHGEPYTVVREWHDGDEVRLTGRPCITVEDGYHQSRTVYRGPNLMVWDGSGAEGYPALIGTPEIRDGKVIAQLCACAPAASADVPVLPKPAGAPFEAELKTFAQCAEGIAVFSGMQTP